MKVLVTGFEPFGGSDVNSSWEAVRRIDLQSFCEIELMIQQIPVTFNGVQNEIETLLKAAKPDVLVMFGQRANSKTIDIERVAINMMDAVKPDNDGFCPNEEVICEDGEAAYYHALRIVEDYGLNTRVVFVHVPKISEGMNIAELASRVNEVIKCILKIV